MKQATLSLLYLVQWLEMIFLFVWTGLLISSGFWFIQRVRDQYTIESSDATVIALVSACMVAALFGVLYNKLFTNLRFLCKINCVTFGLCTFNFFNYLICYCILKKPCRDRCFSWWTIGKWVIKTGLFVATILMVNAKKADWEEDFQVGLVEGETSRLDMYLIVYVLQHPIFIVSRLPIFIVYSILTCCCDKGPEVDERLEFKDRILSFDFIEYETEEHNDFDGAPIGRQELAFNRQL